MAERSLYYNQRLPEPAQDISLLSPRQRQLLVEDYQRRINPPPPQVPQKPRGALHNMAQNLLLDPVMESIGLKESLEDQYTKAQIAALERVHQTSLSEETDEARNLLRLIDIEGLTPTQRRLVAAAPQDERAELVAGFTLPSGQLPSGSVVDTAIGGSRTVVHTPDLEKIHADIDNTYETARANIRNSLALNQSMDQLVDLMNIGVETGTGQTWIDAAKGFARTWGMSVNEEQLGNQEAFLGLAVQSIIPQIKQLGSQPTDKDVELVFQGAPNLQKTERGNRILIEAARIKLERDKARWDVLSEWVRNPANAQMIEKNPRLARYQIDALLLDMEVTNPLFGREGRTLLSRMESLNANEDDEARMNRHSKRTGDN